VWSFASSIRDPQTVDATKGDDWTAVVATFLDADGSYEHLGLLKNGDVRSPSFWKTSIDVFEAIVKTPGPSGHRVRADTARKLAEG
jgi:hypothetical protein